MVVSQEAGTQGSHFAREHPRDGWTFVSTRAELTAAPADALAAARALPPPASTSAAVADAFHLAQSDYMVAVLGSWTPLLLALRLAGAGGTQGPAGAAHFARSALLAGNERSRQHGSARVATWTPEGSETDILRYWAAHATGHGTQPHQRAVASNPKRGRRSRRVRARRDR